MRAHLGVEEEGVKGEEGFGGGSDDGVKEEGVGIRDRREEVAGVGEGAGGDGEGQEFGEEGEGAVEAGDDEVAVDLLERKEAGAGGEEGLVGWGVRS